jgi:hypothetical protein
MAASKGKGDGTTTTTATMMMQINRATPHVNAKGRRRDNVNKNLQVNTYQ